MVPILMKQLQTINITISVDLEYKKMSVQIL